MKEYKFLFNNDEYVLNNESLDCFFNDDEKPIIDFDNEKVLNLLSNNENVDFEVAYYSKACDNCDTEEKKKAYGFLEYHFYVFTKSNKYITSSISDDYVENSFSRLEREGVVDESYIVSIILCENCGKYNVEVEQLEM